MIVASIGYGGTIDDQRARRRREFTPESLRGLPESGEAAAFLRVLQRQLVPAVESRYRANGERSAEEFADMTHQSVIRALFARALPWLFQRRP